jgi:dihydroxyacetone kinase
MNDAAETVNEIGATVRRVMGGTTGILYGHSPDFGSFCN